MESVVTHALNIHFERLFTMFTLLNFKYSEQSFLSLQVHRAADALAGVENTLVFIQNKLHDLVLKHHVVRNVRRLHLWPQQRWTKHDGDILHSHAIVLPELNDPA